MTAPAPTPVSARVLMAPMNFADQPMSLVRALRARGVDAHHLQYTAHGAHPLGYVLDRSARVAMGDFAAQFDILERCLAEGFDVYHFWQFSLLFAPRLHGPTGLDLPLIKAHGARIFHRFTGFDLRLPSQDRAFNRHSPFHHGYHAPFDERAQRRYIDMLRQYVDLFFVQDPEMAQFMPEARLLPRGLDLRAWQPVGVTRSARPLVVHAPSNPEVKGSRFVLAALESLRHAGLAFDFKLIEGMPHAEAREWYRRADIIVDQILIGATGVLTLEAWALGKPCVTYLREDLFEDFYQTSDLPVANATPETIEPVLKRLIGDADWRAELAARGRATVERFHDIEHIADQYLALCAAQTAGRAPVNRNTDDLRFFAPRLLAGTAPRVQDQWPAVDFATRQGLPPQWRVDGRRLNVAGKVELALFNGTLHACAWLLRAQDGLLGRRPAKSDGAFARLWSAEVRLCRALLAAELGVLRTLAGLRRRLRGSD